MQQKKETKKTSGSKTAAKKPTTAKKPAAKKPASKNKAAVLRAASNADRELHLQTRKKVSDPKPNKAEVKKIIRLTEGQEKFVWEKAEPVSGTNQAIYRRDVAGAIIKINEFGLESEFGWVYDLIDPVGEYDDVNNIMAIHWANAKVKRKANEPFISKVTGSRDTKNIYNYMKEQKVNSTVLTKLRKTTLFQPSIVERKKINVLIRKEPKN